MAKKTGEFELKLGRAGLTFFIFVIAVILLLSFISGVIVGKNIESYPEKIAKGIPDAIKKKITENMDVDMDQPGNNENGDNVTGVINDKAQKENNVEFTFYDTLKESGDAPPSDRFTESKPPSIEKRHSASELPVKEAIGPYIIQVASFKDKGMTETLSGKLLSMGYKPTVDNINLGSKGEWFRVKIYGLATYNEAQKAVSMLEKEIVGVKCLIIKNKITE